MTEDSVKDSVLIKAMAAGTPEHAREILSEAYHRRQLTISQYADAIRDICDDGEDP